MSSRTGARRIRAALVVALVGASVSGCKARPDPRGHHTGVCVASFRPVGSSSAKVPSDEKCSDAFEVFGDGEGFKLELGDCTIHLAAAARSDEAEWKVASIAPCKTSAGPTRITEGKLYGIAGTYNFVFEGATDDKKVAVSWGFTGSPPVR